MTTRVRAACLVVVLVGCRELTSAAIPDVVQNTQFNSPAGALIQRAGAIGDFAEAYSLQVVYSGLFSDELLDGTGGDFPADQRRLENFGGTNYPWDSLSQARIQSLRGVAALEQYAPTPSWRIGELFANLGFIEVMFAENMCSGTPLGVLTNGAPATGPTLPRNALLAFAITHFDSARAYAKGTDSIAMMAVIGTARALLDSGDFAAAATVAALVPVSYQFATQYGPQSPFQLNQLYRGFYTQLWISVSNDEGENGLDFVTANDPRLPLVVSGISPFLGGSPEDTIYASPSQSSPASPIVLATGVEARLIQAEAQLPVNGGQGTAWLDTLNALRAGVPGLAPLTDPGTDSARVSLLFRERAFWLFLTGHRHGDLRRLVRQYHRAAESVFPTGPYFIGGVYGNAVAFEPFEETDNPSFHGCLSEGA